jgi:hypothetical protein
MEIEFLRGKEPSLWKKPKIPDELLFVISVNLVRFEEGCFNHRRGGVKSQPK